MGQRTTCHDNQKKIKERRSLRRMEKINCSGLEKNRGRLDKKKARTVNSYRQLNNTQLLTNGDSSSKRFILFKLFLPKSKSINLAFLLTNLP